ncbi:MAG: hypothetical protein ACXWP4_06710 [Polyangiales bacterium]
MVAFAEPSASAIASAKSLVLDGRALRDKGDHKGARDKFKAAYALVQTPIIGIDLAKEHLALGELVEAREVCVEIGKLPANEKESAEGKAARDAAIGLAASLAPRIGSLTVHVVNGPPDGNVTVKIDGETVPAAALSTPRKANPGDHVIVATFGTAEKRVKVVLGEGESKDLTLDLEAVGTSTLPSATEKPTHTQEPATGTTTNGTSTSPLTWVGIAVGAAGIAMGSVSGALALSKGSKAKDQCVENQCPPSSHADYDNSRTWGTISTVSFAVGGAGVVLMVIGLASGRSTTPEKTASRVQPVVGLGSVGLVGSF